MAVPRSLVLKGISLISQTAVAIGGFADIYQASYKGRLVALKRMRAYSNDLAIEMAEAVSTTDVVQWETNRNDEVGIPKGDILLVNSSP